MKKAPAKKTTHNKPRVDVYQIVTDRIIAHLEAGVVPWQKPWNASTTGPRNLVSKKPYRGINLFLLACSGFSSPYFVTYKQAGELGGNVKAGEKGLPVVFWKWLDKKAGEGEGEEIEGTAPGKIPLLRYYTVFNIEQTEGIDPAKIPVIEEIDNDVDPIEEAERIIAAMPNRPVMKWEGAQAYYRPSSDVVVLPEMKTFYNSSKYYTTAFHELTHSTGHACRLGRHEKDKNLSFGSQDYSKEELVAEMGAAFLCAEAGIIQDTIENSAAYIQSWLKKLKDDRRMVVFAAAAAQKSAEFILDRENVIEEEKAA
jgi:antirestriction protein ArdC